MRLGIWTNVMPRRCGFRVRPVYRNPEGRFSESFPGPPDLRTTMITATATATNQQLQRRQPGVSTGSVPCTPLFDWHAPLVEWCGGRKIKKWGTGFDSRVCMLSVQFNKRLN